MIQTHTRTSPEFAILCSLEEGDRVFMDYAGNRIALYAGNKCLCEAKGLYDKPAASGELYLGDVYDSDAGRRVPLYTADLPMVAAAIRYKHESKGLLAVGEDLLPAQFLEPFRTDGDARAYLETIWGADEDPEVPYNEPGANSPDRWTTI